MYTLVVERYKMSKLVEERKRILEICKQNNTDGSSGGSSTSSSKNLNKKFTKKQGEPSEWLKELLVDYSLNQEANENLNRIQVNNLNAQKSTQQQIITITIASITIGTTVPSTIPTIAV